MVDMPTIIVSTWKTMVKIKNHHILSIGTNNLCGRSLSLKLYLGVFKLVEETSQVNEGFPESYNEESDIFYDKREYNIYTKNLKQALNHELLLKKLHRVIEFSQKAWLKSYTDMNAELRKK